MEIGNRIKALRQKNNLTIEELANRCELTKGFISQLERDLSSPSIETLQSILQTLGTNLSDFFKVEKKRKFVFTQADRYIVENENYKIEWLIPNAQANEMEPILITLQSNSVSQKIMPFDGEIFGYVLQGEVTIFNGEKSFLTKINDSFYLYGNKQHYLKNETNQITQILWITAPPYF